jgi:nitrogen fixation-related uncharacterized protein
MLSLISLVAVLGAVDAAALRWGVDSRRLDDPRNPRNW